MVEFVKLKDSEEGPVPKKSKNKFFSFKYFLIAFLLLFFLSSIISAISFAITPKIGLVPITGIISTEREVSIYGSTISSREIANTIRDLSTDESVKAILLDINSGGGTPVATEEISRAIEEVRGTKPIYALVSDVGASGAFWIAVTADNVYASSMSVLGSIGVTSATLSFEDFIRDFNITYRKQTAGEFKDMGSIFREPTEEEEEMLQEVLDEIHDNFIRHVARSREMSYEEVKEHSNGEVFLGTKALDIGFIDKIGYYPDVINSIENETGFSDLMVVDYGPQPTFFESLGTISFSSNLFSNFQNGINLK